MNNNTDLIKALCVIIAIIVVPSLFDDERYHRTALHPIPKDEIKTAAERANANAYRNLSGHHRKTSMLALEVHR